MLEKLVSMNNVNVENIYGRTTCLLNLDDKGFIVSNELKYIYNLLNKNASIYIYQLITDKNKLYVGFTHNLLER
jgi:hypothetical protein